MVQAIVGVPPRKDRFPVFCLALVYIFVHMAAPLRTQRIFRRDEENLYHVRVFNQQLFAIVREDLGSEQVKAPTVDYFKKELIFLNLAEAVDCIVVR